MSAQDVLVLAEIQRDALADITLELLAAARGVTAATGGQVVCLVLSEDGAKYAPSLAAADRIVLVNDPQLAAFAPEPHLAALLQVVTAEQPRAVLVGGTSVGWDLAPLLAGRLQAPSQGWGLIDLPLVGDWPNRPRQIVDYQLGKPSLTRWRVLSHDESGAWTRVELEPVTGRSHQLRVHLRELGHPILGDDLYAPPEVRDMAQRLLLHAAWLSFAHPVTGERLAFECPAPF